MSIGPAIYLNQVGSTGRVNGPHAHFELRDTKTNQLIPLSRARADIGQRIQFRLPGSQDWQQLYRQIGPNQFQANPNAPLTSPLGDRLHPVTKRRAFHGGEDYGLPEGTDLRFLGSGSVEGLSNYGNAGNVARLRTGDNRYQVDVFHLKNAPGAARVGDTAMPAAPVLPTSLSNQGQDVNVATETVNKSIRDALMGSLLEQAFLKRNEGVSQTNPYSQAFITQEMINEFA
jgi:hypothetical protein